MVTSGLLFVGIDIGKASLDVAAADLRLKVANDREGHIELLKKVRALKRHLHFVAETDNGYGRKFINFLFTRRCKVSLINPYRVRSFARARGRLAKTDAIDSIILSEYGESFRPAPSPKPSKLLERLQHVVRRRRQIGRVMKAQNLQRQRIWDAELRRDANKLIKELDARVVALRSRAEAMIQSCPILSAKYRAFLSVKCVGPLTAMELVAEMPELGTMNRGQAAALAGLAPFNHDTGSTLSPRHIRGGRFNVRLALFMSAISASHHNPALKDFYKRLRDNGKPGKVAIVAVMRKMIIRLNNVARMVGESSGSSPEAVQISSS